MSHGHCLFRTPAIVQLCSAILVASASATDFSFSGFSSITEGKVLSGNAQNASLGQQFKCPCTIANYEYAGVYQNNGWTAQPESIVGLQADIKVDDQLSAVVQVDGRDVNNFKASLDWAYVSYKINGDWTVQAGQKRIPMYLYADSNYIGYSYVWVRPPVDVYGWDVYDYEGFNVLYKKNLGDWGLLANVWAGDKDSTNNQYWQKLYNGGTTTESNWKNIIGSYVDLSNDTFDFRAIYMQNNIALTAFTAPGVPYVPGMDGTAYRQKVYGFAFTADLDPVLLRLEANTVKRTAPWAAPSAPSMLAGVGYKVGQVTGMLTYSRYWETTSATYTGPQRDDTRTATLRWDFHKNIALKAQYDYIKDSSPTPSGGKGAFMGDSRLVTVSLVSVF